MPVPTMLAILCMAVAADLAEASAEGGPDPTHAPDPCVDLDRRTCTATPGCEGVFGPGSLRVGSGAEGDVLQGIGGFIKTQDIAFQRCRSVSDKQQLVENRDRLLCLATEGTWVLDELTAEGSCRCPVAPTQDRSVPNLGEDRSWLDAEGRTPWRSACALVRGEWRTVVPQGHSVDVEMGRSECEAATASRSGRWDEAAETCPVTTWPVDTRPVCVVADVEVADHRVVPFVEKACRRAAATPSEDGG